MSIMFVQIINELYFDVVAIRRVKCVLNVQKMYGFVKYFKEFWNEIKTICLFVTGEPFLS